MSDVASGRNDPPEDGRRGCVLRELPHARSGPVSDLTMADVLPTFPTMLVEIRAFQQPDGVECRDVSDVVADRPPIACRQPNDVQGEIAHV